MTEGLLQVIILVVSGLTLLGLATLAIVVVRRLPQSGAGKQEASLNRIAENQDRLALAVRPLVVSSRPLDSVITRLTFAESIDPEQFAIASRESALGHLNSLLKTGVSDGVMVTVNSVRLLPSGAEMTVSTSRAGQVLLKRGTVVIPRHGASGRALPFLKDARTGKFIETMKGVPAAKTLSRLGAMSSVVVGAAHIVSGADIAKRLKQIESKMDLLLAYRRIDQMAALERIYTSARELAGGRMSRDKCWELWRLRGELRELRIAWRRELQNHLMLVEDPQEAGWLRRMFTPQKSIDRKIHAKITEGQLQVGLIEYSIRLDQVLAVGSGTVREFEDTLAGELSELEAVRSLLQNKSELISGKHQDFSVEPMVQAMSQVIEQYKGLLPERSEPPECLPMLQGTAEEHVAPPKTEEAADADDR